MAPPLSQMAGPGSETAVEETAGTETAGGPGISKEGPHSRLLLFDPFAPTSHLLRQEVNLQTVDFTFNSDQSYW